MYIWVPHLHLPVGRDLWGWKTDRWHISNETHGSKIMSLNTQADPMCAVWIPKFGQYLLISISTSRCLIFMTTLKAQCLSLLWSHSLEQSLLILYNFLSDYIIQSKAVEIIRSLSPDKRARTFTLLRDIGILIQQHQGRFDPSFCFI